MRLAFVTERPRSLILDGVLAGPGPLGQAGTFVTVEIAHSYLSWVDLMVEGVLAGWAEEDRVVDLRLDVGARARAEIASAGSCVRGHVLALTAA